MPHYDWKTIAVDAAPNTEFAAALTAALNRLENEGYEVEKTMDAPAGREAGVIVVGKRPARPPKAVPA